MTDPVALSIVIRYLSIIINIFTLIFGTLGGLCNLITFTSSKLRRSSCVFYMLFATIFQLMSILIIVPTRISLDYFGNGLEHQSIIFCKLRYYLVITLPELATSFILLAILDRCLATSTHARMRKWSQLKVAHRLATIVLISSLVRNVHVLVFYTIYDGNCQAPPRTFYALFIAVYSLCVIILLPHTLMLILSLITVWHLRQAKRRILPTATIIQNHRRIHRFEVHIITVGATSPSTSISSIKILSISGNYRSCHCNVTLFVIAHGFLLLHHLEQCQFAQDCRRASCRKLFSAVRCIAVLSEFCCFVLSLYVNQQVLPKYLLETNEDLL